MIPRRAEWDDLLFVLAVGQAGSLSAAARVLRVNHSTMFRRIGAVEEKLGVRLFDRRRDGYAPTAAGEAVIEVAMRMDEEVVALERRLAGADLSLRGTVRFATTETLLPMLLPICAGFKAEHPCISVELVTGPEMLDLSRRDADVALRASVTPPASLHGRRVARVDFGVFGRPGLFNDEVEASQWVGLDESMSHVQAHSWLKSNILPERLALKVNTFTALEQAAALGLGLTILPIYLGGRNQSLQCYESPVQGVSTDLWLLVHEDLRHTARVRAFLDYVYGRLAAARSAFEVGAQ